MMLYEYDVKHDSDNSAREESKNMLLERKYHRNLVREKKLSDNILNDFFDALDYVPLSSKEEISYIKKAQLSFYDDVDDEHKQIFLKNYAEEVPKFRRKYENASLEEKEKILEDAILNSMEWRDWFITNNQRFILSVATKYIEGLRSLTLMDLVQEGNFGLLKALEKYDCTKENKFFAYAINWIKQFIQRAYINKNDSIRQPIGFFLNCKKINMARKDLSQKLHREPSYEELSLATGFGVDQIKKALYYMYFQSEPLSLNKIIYDTDDIELGETLVSDGPQVEDQVIDKVFTNEFIQLLNNCGLTKRELEILYKRFGFNNDEIMTYSALAEQYGISRSRVQQIECAVIKKLGNNEAFQNFYSEKVKKLK